MTLTQVLFPGIAGMRIEQAWHEVPDEGREEIGPPHQPRRSVLHVQATTSHMRAPCPCCGRRSRWVQSRYARTLADVPCGGTSVTLHLRVRRFRCRVPWCRRRIFCERVPEVAAPQARRTVRLHDQLRQEVLRFGGEPAARQAKATGTPVSARTLLRVARATPRAPVGRVRVLGVDDWSRRKGHDFGTILVDLEAHRTLDLLPDRTATTLATWLHGHPEVEIVSRDRAGAYADGVRRGAPQAVQVADRFHLLKNLTEALERTLTRHHGALRAAARAAAPQPAAGPATAGNELQVPTKAQQAQQARRERQHARYTKVVALHEQGHSQVQIAGTLRMSRKTVRRFLRVERPPERLPAPRRGRTLDRYAPYLQARWAVGCDNALELWREVQAQGYPGAASTVRQFLASWRAHPSRPGRKGPRHDPERRRAAPPARPPAVPRSYSSRQTAWLLYKDDASRTDDERVYVAHLLQACPPVARLQLLARTFRDVVRLHDVAAFARWLDDVGRSGIPELCGFANGLRADRAAVEAGITLPWSQGQTEGQVNRLKTLKRAMYGRANFDLLRICLLHSA